MSSSVTSGEHNAQQNFNPSWMRSTFATKGGPIGSSPRASLNDDSHVEELSTPVLSNYRYGREELLALMPNHSNPPVELSQLGDFFIDIASTPTVTLPLSEHEQRLQQNINSSKAMSSLSHHERAQVAAGNAYGGGYGANRNFTPVKSNAGWSRGASSADRPQRGSPGARGSHFAYGRGALRGGINGGGTPGATENGSNPQNVQHNGEDSPTTPFGNRFNAASRGRGAAAVARGASATAAAFNSRAQGLYNPKDPSDRPRPVTAAQRSGSDEADDDGEGWSTVAPRNAWTRSNSQQEQSQNAWPRPEGNAWSRGNEPTNGSGNSTSSPWNRASMVQQQLGGQTKRQQSIPEWMNDGGDTDELSATSSGVFDENGIFRGKTQHTQPTASAQSSSSSGNTDHSASQFNWHATNVNATPTSSVPVSTTQVQPESLSNFEAERLRLAQQSHLAALAAQQQALAQVQIPDRPVEFYYIDPTDKTRGPFSKENMVDWFKAGYFSEETLRIRRGTDAEFKTISELKIQNGLLSPFDYPDERVMAAPLALTADLHRQAAFAAANINPYPQMANAFNAPAPYNMFGSQNMWAPPVMDPAAVSYGLPAEQQQKLEAQRQLEEQRRQLLEEQEKFRVSQEKALGEMLKQKQEAERQMREQQDMLLKHKEEIHRREREMHEQAEMIKNRIELEHMQLEEKKRRIEAENAAKLAEEKKKKEEEVDRKRKEEFEKKKKAAEENARRVEEAERERQRLKAEAEAEEAKRRLEKKRAEDAARRKREEEEAVAEALRVAEAEEEKERRAAERQAKLDAEKFEIQQAWTAAPKPKQVQPSVSEEEGWQTVSAVPKTSKPKVAPWAAAQKPVQSVYEIQIEEERQMKAEQERLAKIRKEEAAASATVNLQTAGSWGNSSQRLQWNGPVVKPAATKGNVWGTPSNEPARTHVSPFLDGPTLEAANKVQTAAASKKSTTAPKATAASNNKQNDQKKKQDDVQTKYMAWFIHRYQQIAGHGVDVADIEVLFNFVVSIDNPNEVEDYVMSYLGEGKAVKEFVREFLQKRIELRNRGGRVDADDLSSARTAPAAASSSSSAPGSSSAANAAGKKKKKTSKTVLDGTILGFRGAAASDRLNKGEIETVPLPVPTRR